MPVKKDVPDCVTFPFKISSIVITPAHPNFVTALSTASALVIPVIEEAQPNSRAKIKNIEGQYSSHLPYCSLSLFWQILGGQQLGQQQQQHSQGHIKIIIIKPIRNGPMKNIIPGILSEATDLASYLLSLNSVLIKFFPSILKYVSI